MKKILAGLFGVVLLAIAGILAFVAVQPSEIRVARSVEINAAVDDVAPFIRDLRKADAWSPWTELDPDLEQTYSAQTDQVGSTYDWNGDDTVGAGRMTMRVNEPGRVVHDVHFTRPFEGDIDATITWSGDDKTTNVNWAFHQEAGFLDKAANLAFGIEASVGDDYERGLQKLKPLAEKATQDRLAKLKAEKEAKEAAAKALLDAQEALKKAQEAAAGLGM